MQGPDRMGDWLLGFAGTWEERKAKGKVKHEPLRVHGRKAWVTGGQGGVRILAKCWPQQPAGRSSLSSRQRRCFAHLCTQQWPTHNRCGLTFIFFTSTPLQNEPLVFYILEKRIPERDRDGKGSSTDRWHSSPPFCTQEHLSILCLGQVP